MLKNLLILYFALISGWVFGQGQFDQSDRKSFNRCGTSNYVKSKTKVDPNYRTIVEQTRKNRQKIIDLANQKRLVACPNGEVLVPVAVHFDTGIGTNADERSCLISLVNSQMKVLNDAFNGLNDADCTTTPTNGACIKFRLANTNHPEGSGLSDGDPAITYNGAYTCPNATPCNVSGWSGMLNIVVQDMLSLSNGPLGIAPLNGSTSAGGPANSFLVDLCGFGTEQVFCDQAGPNSCSDGFKYRNGNTTVHEAGHFYGLEHTFCQDSNGNPEGGENCLGCAGSLNCDGFTDTPIQCYSNYTCFSGTCSESIQNPCGGTSVFNNFMDYLVDKCMNSFSPQQTTTMNEIADADFYKVAAIGDYAPICNFNLRTADGASYVSENQNIKVCGSSTFPLEESSTNNATNFNWNFSTLNGLSVNQTSSTLANPKLRFSGSAGILIVELNVSNENGTCSSLSKSYSITPSIELSANLNNCISTNNAQINLDVGNTIGNVSFSPAGLVNGTSNPYSFQLNGGTDCNDITILAEDNGISIDKGNFEIIAPFEIAGSYVSGTNNVDAFGIDIESVSPCVAGTLALVNDGEVPTTDFCTPEPPATPTQNQCTGLSGNIAVIDRGDCFFTAKIENAQACGAIAAVICNCEPLTENCNAGSETEIITMSGESVNDITIPSVFISYQLCQQIKMTIDSQPVRVCIGAERTGGCVQSITLNACDLCSTTNSSAGCTDVCSSNYNPTATINDGSCLPYSNPSINGLPEITFNTTPISLSATPAGGTFSGEGVSFFFFNPSISGIGVKEITYTYTNENGCTLSTNQTILVGNLSFQFVDYDLYFESP